MRLERSIFGLVALITLGAACASFGGAGGSDAPTDDAGAPASDSGAPASDSGAPASDSGPPVNDAGDRFCAHTDAAFCIDFDGPPVGAFALQDGGASIDDIEGNGSLAISAGANGNELVSTLPPADAQTTRVAAQRFLLPGVGDIVLEADVMIETIASPINDDTSNIAFASLFFGTGSPVADLFACFINAPPVPLALSVRPPVEVPTYTLASGYALPYETPFHIVMKAGGAGDNATAIRFDLAMGDSGTFSDTGINRTLQSANAQTLLGLGLAHYPNSNLPEGMTVHIDNVTVNPL